MKSFNILFSILAIVIFATACMNKEKDILIPNQPELRQTIQNQTIQENKGGDDIMQTCPPPTNLTHSDVYMPGTTISTGNRKFSWLPPQQQVSFYSVKFYVSGTLIINTTVTNPEIIVPLSSMPTPAYSIEVRSSCSSNTMSLPLTYSGGGGGSGGPTVVIMGELNDYTSANATTQSIPSVTYSYSTAHNSWNPSTNTTTFNYSICADNLYHSPASGTVSPSFVTVSPITGVPFTCQFNVPTLTGLKNTECIYTENNITKYHLDMKVLAPSGTLFPQSTLIAYQMVTYPLSTQWTVINTENKPFAVLRRLKRGKQYRIKIFSSISSFASYTPITLTCESPLPTLN